MACPRSDPLDDADYLRRLNRKATEQRVPLSGSIELTRRCNLRWRAPATRVAQGGPAQGRRELATAEWLSILDQAVEAGCLELLITGGEPCCARIFQRCTAMRSSAGC